eukprot:TRINITY_DN33542_c0_g1_i1.p1 TRINITY_DN33542_c0_g1~~TRINITY_DN33542_c0_g1_i1.p1  ORF type:complete len:1610 (-),score=412.13 TRINITY_DN33542_c0_g1_i1:69-4898(-)
MDAQEPPVQPSRAIDRSRTLSPSRVPRRKCDDITKATGPVRASSDDLELLQALSLECDSPRLQAFNRTSWQEEETDRGVRFIGVALKSDRRQLNLARRIVQDLEVQLTNSKSQRNEMAEIMQRRIEQETASRLHLQEELKAVTRERAEAVVRDRLHADADERLESLQRSQAALQVERNELLSSLEKITAENRRLQLQLDRAEIERDKLASESKKVTSVAASLETAEKQYAASQARCHDLETCLEDERNCNRRLRIQIEKISQEREMRFGYHYEDMKTRLAIADAERQELSSGLEQERTMVKRLQIQLETLSVERDQALQVSQVCASASEELKTLQTRLVSLEEERSELMLTAVRERSSSKHLTAQVETLTRECKEAHIREQLMHNAEEHLTGVREQLARAADDRQNLAEMLEQERATARNLREELIEEVTSSKSSAREAAVQLSEAKADSLHCSELRKQLAASTADQQAVIEELDLLRSTRAALQQRLETCNLQLEALQEGKSGIARELALSRSEVSSLQSRLDQALSTESSLQRRIVDTMAESGLLKEELRSKAALDQENALELQSKLITREREVEMLETQLQAMHSAAEVSKSNHSLQLLDLQGQIAAAEEERQTLLIRRSDLDRQVTELSMTLSAEQEAKQVQSSDLDKLSSELKSSQSTLRCQLIELQGKLDVTAEQKLCLASDLEISRTESEVCRSKLGRQIDDLNSQLLHFQCEKETVSSELHQCQKETCVLEERLQSCRSDLYGRIEQLQFELNTKQEELTVRESKNNFLAQELRSQIAACQAEKQVCNDKLRVSQADCSTLENQLETCRRELGTQMEELQHKLTSSEREKQTAALELKQQTDSFRSRLASKDEEQGRLTLNFEAQVQELRRQVAALHADKQQAATELQVSRTGCSTLEARLETCRFEFGGQVEELQKNLNTIREERQACETELGRQADDFRSRFSAVQNENKSMKLEMNMMQSRASQTENEKEELLSELAASERSKLLSAQELGRQADDLCKRLAAANGEKHALTLELDMSHSQSSRLEGQVKALNCELAVLEEDKQGLTVEVNLLRSSASQLQERADTFTHMEHNLQDVTRNFRLAESQLSELRGEQALQLERCTQLELRVQRFDAERETLLQLEANGKSAHLEARAELSDVSSQLAEALAACSELQETLRKERSNSQLLQFKLNRLQEERDKLQASESNELERVQVQASKHRHTLQIHLEEKTVNIEQLAGQLKAAQDEIQANAYTLAMQQRRTEEEHRRSSAASAGCAELMSCLEQEREGSKLLRLQLATLRAEQNRSDALDEQRAEVQQQTMELRSQLKRSETENRELAASLKSERDNLRDVLMDLEAMTKQRDDAVASRISLQVQELQVECEAAKSECAEAKKQVRLEQEGAALLSEQIRELKKERHTLLTKQAMRTLEEKKSTDNATFEDLSRMLANVEAERNELALRLEQERCGKRRTSIQLDASRAECEEAVDRLRKSEAHLEGEASSSRRSSLLIPGLHKGGFRGGSRNSIRGSETSSSTSSLTFFPTHPQLPATVEGSVEPHMASTIEPSSQNSIQEESPEWQLSQLAVEAVSPSKVRVNLVGKLAVDLQESPGKGSAVVT